MPNVEYGLTKYAIDRWAARCFPPAWSHANIRGAAQRAAEGFAAEGTGKYRLHKLEGEIEHSVTFSSTAEALMAALIPGSVRETPRTVSCRAANAIDAWKGFFAVLLLGWSATDEIYGNGLGR